MSYIDLCLLRFSGGDGSRPFMMSHWADFLKMKRFLALLYINGAFFSIAADCA